MESETFDRLVAGLYRAAGGGDWAHALGDIAQALDSWCVQVMGVDKRTGALLFSHYGGIATPGASLGYITRYHAIDPRVQLLMREPYGTWVHCHEHFDEAFVARSAFYQEFFLPNGGRWVSGRKVLEDEQTVAVFSAMRGSEDSPYDAKDRVLLERLATHMHDALRIYRHLRTAFEEASAGRDLLDRFAYPILLVDELCGIRFRNGAAAAALADGDYVTDRSGVLVCRDRDDHAELMRALQDLGLQGESRAQASTAGRRHLRIRRRSGKAAVIANVVAIRPQATMGAFGSAPMALVLFHDPTAKRELDPFLMEELFELTPAEARVAVRLRDGASAKAIAAQLRLSPATVRSQIQAIFAKTGTRRQVDLIRLLEGLCRFETFSAGR